jgi:Ca-activated chloride channel family protein
LLALQPVLMSLFVSLPYRRQRRAYADSNLLPWVMAGPARHEKSRTGARFLLLQICWILMALAMAGPRYPDPQQTPDHASAADVMVVVDVSRSMTATDVRPDRLTRAKTELSQFLLQNKADRIGIILFAGHAHLLNPLTLDRNALRFYAQAIQANLLPTEGSNLAEAIKLANKYLQHSNNPAILILTDGETRQGIEAFADLISTPLYILGIGSHAGTSIPSTEGGWLMYDNSPVRSRLHSEPLQTLASSSGGQYALMTDELGILGKIYQQARSINTGRKSVASIEQAWVELYPWVLLPALLLLLLMSVQGPWPSVRQKTVTALTVILSACVLLPVDDVNAQALTAEGENQAYTAYAEKDYRKALDVYAIHTGYKARMGEGSSAYQLEDYARASTQFTQAFLSAENDAQRANALYNLANSFFKLENYASAQATYEDVLRYRQQHQQALANLQFVKSVIASQAQDIFSSTARAKRAGRGPRSLLADENTRGGGDFSLDDEEAKLTPSARQGLQQGDPDLLDIIASGKGRAQVADERLQVQGTREMAPVSVTQLLQARRVVLQGQRDQSGLWKSLFEEEEGFPAPLEQPQTEPGVLPW